MCVQALKRSMSFVSFDWSVNNYYFYRIENVEFCTGKTPFAKSFNSLFLKIWKKFLQIYKIIKFC